MMINQLFLIEVRLKLKPYLVFLLAIMITTLNATNVAAQIDTRYMRIAKIVIDSVQLDNYNAALKEGMHDAVSKEPGVISLSAVYEKEQPTHVTVFEIYASVDAYKQHIQTPHFLKYKTAVKDMVKSLELVDVDPIALESKTSQ